MYFVEFLPENVRISMVTLIEKRMALEMGQFSGFLYSQNTKPYLPEGGWIHIYIAIAGWMAAS